MMKHIFKTTLLLLLINTAAYSQYLRMTNEIDTPTAYTIGRGTYQVSLLGYDQGGMELKTFIGLHDNIFLGVSVDVEHTIGKDKPEPNVPGVIAKVKLTDGWEVFPISFAIGYDSFYIGSLGKKDVNDNPGTVVDEAERDKLNRMMYGPYAVITKPIYLFDEEQHLNFGIRVPAQPDYIPKDTSYFTSLDIPIGSSVTLKGEIERVYYNFKKHEDWLYNAGIRYSFFKQVSLEFNFIMQEGERANRTLKVEYTDEF